MRRMFLISGIIMALVLAVLAASAAAPANFAGSWALDKAKSQGLDPRMQNAESVQWVITQDDKKISIEPKVVAGQPPAGAPPAGGPPAGGGGGGRGPGGPRSFNLDGKEATTEAGGQMGGTSTTKATWSSDGKTLELVSVRTGNRDGTEFKFTTTEKLTLSDDGKVLTVQRHSEGPRGPQDATLVFNKQYGSVTHNRVFIQLNHLVALWFSIKRSDSHSLPVPAQPNRIKYRSTVFPFFTSFSNWAIYCFLTAIQ
jgi:hypothetical protein